MVKPASGPGISNLTVDILNVEVVKYPEKYHVSMPQEQPQNTVKVDQDN